MAKKNNKPKISLVNINYNGDRERFDRFIESIIGGYLLKLQDSMPKIAESSSVQKVEKDDKTA